MKMSNIPVAHLQTRIEKIYRFERYLRSKMVHVNRFSVMDQANRIYLADLEELFFS